MRLCPNQDNSKDLSKKKVGNPVTSLISFFDLNTMSTDDPHKRVRH